MRQATPIVLNESEREQLERLRHGRRVTDQARLVPALANQSGLIHKARHVESEHILWAILRAREGAATVVIRTLGVDPRDIDAELARRLEPGKNEFGGKLPQTEQFKQVMKRAAAEAERLGSNVVGTDHVLLGLLSLTPSLAFQVLDEAGITLEAAREAISRIFDSSACVYPERRTGPTTPEEQREIKQEQQRRENERRLIQDLHSQVTRWRQANEIRSYLKHVRSAATHTDLEEGSDLVEWMHWAEGYADGLDPISKLRR